MSTMIQGVEKEFLIKAFFNEQIAIMCTHNRVEYTLTIEKLTKAEIFFKADKAVTGLVLGNKINLTADYNGVIVVFVVMVHSINHIDQAHFSATMPEILYKNLDRAYPRVIFPLDMQFKFSFLQERYLLPFSEDGDSQSLTGTEVLPDIKTFQDIASKLASWVKESDKEYRLVLFKDIKVLTLEEQIIAKTGKTLFLPSTQGTLLETDPDPKRRIITMELFTQFLETIGVMPTYVNAALEQFIKSKQSKQIFSDAWIPLRFREYVAGYIHFWSTKPAGSPLEVTVIENLYLYANSLVESLKEKGYFEFFNLKERIISAQGVDISAGGIQFACSQPSIADLLFLDSELLIKLITPKRTVNLKTKILRRYAEKNLTFYGCNFFDVAPEDVRFLYEFIYGKPFTEAVAAVKV